MSKWLLSLCAVSIVPLLAEECEQSYELRPVRAGVRHIEGKGIGYTRGYTSLDFLFTDLSRDSIFPFLDIRGHYFDNGKLAANAGVGFRYLCNSVAYGLNAYYDYRHDYRHHFSQAGAGFEVLGSHWEGRLNGYFPFGNRSGHKSDIQFGSFQGNSIFLKYKQRVAMEGGDAEVGYNWYAHGRDYTLYAGIGPYYLHPECGKAAIGGKVRLNGKWKDYISLEITESYDEVFHNVVQGQIAFTLPLGPKPKDKSAIRCFSSAMQQRLAQRVVRNEIIALSKCTKHPKAIDPNTGDPYEVFFVDNTSHSNGTFESPFNTLAAAESAAQPNNIIYVYPGDGTSTGMDAGITLQDGQQLLGASTSQPIATQVGTVVIPPQASFLPIIASGADVVKIANGNTISGLYIEHAGGHGVVNLAPFADLNVTNNLFQGATGNGVELTDASGHLTIASNQFNEALESININSTDVHTTTYSIAGNYFLSEMNSNVVNMSLTDCTEIATTVLNNTFMTLGRNVSITTNNAVFSSLANVFTMENNYFSSFSPIITLNLQNGSNSTINFNSNQGISSGNFSNGKGFAVTMDTLAQADFTITNNTIRTQGFLFDLQSTSTGALSLSASQNLIDAGGGFSCNLTDTPFDLTFNNNRMNTSDSGVVVSAAGASAGPFTVADNSINTYSANGAVVLVASDAAASFPVSVSGNFIHGSRNALTIEFPSGGSGAITLSGNTVINDTISPGVIVTTAGKHSVDIANNTINSAGQGIQTSFLNLSAEPQVVTIVNNQLRAMRDNISASVTNFSNVDMTIASNTGFGVGQSNSGTNGIVILALADSQGNFLVKDNFFETPSNAFVLVTNSSRAVGTTVENNTFVSLENNVVEFQVQPAGGTFTASIQDNQISRPPTSINTYTSKIDLWLNCTNAAIGDLTIAGNTFHGSDVQLEIDAAGTTQIANAVIQDNLFSLSGNASMSPNGALVLNTADASQAKWNVTDNTFTGWVVSAADITSDGTSSTCLIFNGNVAQPRTGAYTLSRLGGSTFTYEPFTGDIPTPAAPGGAVQGTCP